MKTGILVFIVFVLAISFGVRADNAGLVSYYPVVTGEGVPEASKKLLISKMEQALAYNGFGSINRADRFVMVAKCHVLEKDIAPTTPPRISQSVEISFILGDVVENKTFASVSMVLKGIGTNETKAWQTAINRISPKAELLSEAFSEANSKIEQFYAANCESILKMANSLADQNNYDEAIAKAMSIPDVCTSCYDKACRTAVDLYNKKINYDGVNLLQKAKSIWSASQDEEAAVKALNLLSEIDHASDSSQAATELGNMISSHVSAEKEREWQQRLKEYNDDKEFRRREQANSHQRSMATIAACRSVAEKWAENQPQNNVYLKW